MGCTGSKLPFPGLSSSPCLEYTDRRRKACKDLLAAHDALLDSATQHAGALKTTGAALSVLFGNTNIFESPNGNPNSNFNSNPGTGLASSNPGANAPPSSFGGNPGQGPAPPYGGNPGSKAPQSFGGNYGQGAPSQYGGNPGPGALPSYGGNSGQGGPPPYGGNPGPNAPTPFGNSGQGVPPQYGGNPGPGAPQPYGGNPGAGAPPFYGGNPGSGGPSPYGANPGPGQPPSYGAQPGPGSHPPGAVAAPPAPEPQFPSGAAQQQRVERPGPEAQDKKQALGELSQKLDDVFLQMAALLTRPLQEVLSHTSSLSKSAMPNLAAAACKTADGNLEPIGNSLQKLLIWEQHLKDDTKHLESLRHSQHKGGKKLDKRSAQANKDPNRDLGKVRAAQDKVNEAEARIAGASKSVVDTVKLIEQFKLEVLYPQAARLFPVLVEVYKTSESLFQHQKSLASEIAALKPVPGSLPEEWEEPSLLASDSAQDGEGAAGKGNKGYHGATKDLDGALTKWSSSIEAFAMAQRNYCAALLAWVRATTNMPADFPKPTGDDMAQLRPGPNGSKDAESSFAGLANDWNKAIDKLPEAPLREALGSMSRALQAAFELQTKEGKEHKKLDSAKKELAKAEDKLRAATEEEEKWKQAALETRTDPKKAKEHHKREQHVEKASKELEKVRGTFDTAKDNYNAERAAYENIVHKECDTAGAALQNGLPEVFQRCIEYSGAAANEFRGMQAAYAPWAGRA